MAIYSLSIERFRGILSLKWQPARGVNIILGGGDTGKTTILEAIALLLSPVNPTNLSDPDYHDRQIEAGFLIEGVLSLPPASGIGNQMKPSWPWQWTGNDVSIPNMDDEGTPNGEPVYRVRVRGTEDLELAYEIMQPDGSTDSFPVTLRRSIGLVRLGAMTATIAISGLCKVPRSTVFSPTKGYARAWRVSSRRQRQGRVEDGGPDCVD